MLFSSITFLGFFFPVVLIAYYALPHRAYRNAVLLLASMLFYAWGEPKFVLLMLASVLFNYNMGIFIADRKESSKKFLIFAIAVNLGILFVFKYLGFSCQIVNYIIGSLHLKPIETINLILPIGISFYTFQTLSYVIDVYRQEIKAEKHFGIYATFVSFFPQLVAGPIERSGNLLPQIKEKHVFDIEKARYGIWLIVWGVFKKVIVADNLAVFVDQVYGDVYNYSGFSLVLATLFFTFQIYCDFSGYSDIARGSANLFGIELMENFKSPYFSESVKDFWSRWHISLSSWFRDYLYIPMGGNRVGTIRNCFNVLVTFLVSGLWHGASWNFVIWGGCTE